MYKFIKLAVVCFLSRCLSVSNKPAEPIKPNIFVATHMSPGEVYAPSKIKVLPGKNVDIYYFSEQQLKTKIMNRKGWNKAP